VTPSEYAEELCGLISPCCEAFNLSTEMERCKERFGTTPASPSAAQECIDTLRARAENPSWCFDDNRLVEACDLAFPVEKEAQGTAGPGEPCESDEDCAPGPLGVTCRPWPPEESVCRIYVAGKKGEECFGSRDGDSSFATFSDSRIEVPLCDRADGLVCDDVCVAAAQEGEPCGSDGACVAGQHCPGDVCVPLVSPGGSCGNDPDACVDEAYCDAATGTCALRKPDGSGCYKSFECETGFCNSNHMCGPGGLDMSVMTICL
jgi:hypothetical protein